MSSTGALTAPSAAFELPSFSRRHLLHTQQAAAVRLTSDSLTIDTIQIVKPVGYRLGAVEHEILSSALMGSVQVRTVLSRK